MANTVETEKRRKARGAVKPMVNPGVMTPPTIPTIPPVQTQPSLPPAGAPGPQTAAALQTGRTGVTPAAPMQMGGSPNIAGGGLIQSMTGVSPVSQADHNNGAKALLNSRGMPGQTGAGQLQTPVEPTTRGFTAFFQNRTAGANWMASTADNKAGFVARSGAFRGQPRSDVLARLRLEYGNLSPQEKQKWEEIADKTNDVTPSPYRQAMQQAAERGAQMGEQQTAAAPETIPAEQPEILADKSRKKPADEDEDED